MLSTIPGSKLYVSECERKGKEREGKGRKEGWMDEGREGRKRKKGRKSFLY